MNRISNVKLFLKKKEEPGIRKNAIPPLFSFIKEKNESKMKEKRTKDKRIEIITQHCDTVIADIYIYIEIYIETKQKKKKKRLELQTPHVGE